MAKRPDLHFGDDFDFDGPTIEISEQTGHSIVGFGGAFTESASDVFAGLPQSQQEEIIEAYFGETGIGYTLGRVPINSNDFADEEYAFDNMAGDMALEYFDDTVAHDAKSIIPFILKAKEAVAARGQTLKLLATPWSPPAWMKANGAMKGSDEKCLLQGMEPVWASYISRWISAYNASGAPVWAVTPQNQPTGDPPWENCKYTAEDEGAFVANHLGPTLQADHPGVHILIHDDNKDSMVERVFHILSDPEAAKYVSGVGFHWFAGDQIDAVEQVHGVYPEAILLATGATHSMANDGRRGHIDFYVTGDWGRGKAFARAIIGDLNAGAAGWMDWNLVLDSKAGPNRLGNYCDSAIVADAKMEVSYHPQYYFMGHFSKFLPPGSLHLDSSIQDNVGDGHMQEKNAIDGCNGDGLQATSFQRPDGNIVLVVLNCGEGPVGFKITRSGSSARTEIPPAAIQTYIISADTPGPISLVADTRGLQESGSANAVPQFRTKGYFQGHLSSVALAALAALSLTVMGLVATRALAGDRSAGLYNTPDNFESICERGVVQDEAVLRVQ